MSFPLEDRVPFTPRTAREKQRDTIRMLQDQVLELSAQALLRGAQNQERFIIRTLGFNNVSFHSGSFVVLLISIENSTRLHFNTALEDFTFDDLIESYVIIRAIVEETLSDKFLCLTAAEEHTVTCILNPALEGFPSSPAILDEVHAKAEQIQSIIFENVGIDLTFYISQVHSNLEGIATAYQEAQRMLEYARLVMDKRPSVIDSREYLRLHDSSLPLNEYYTALRAFLNSSARMHFSEAISFLFKLLDLYAEQNFSTLIGLKEFGIWCLQSTCGFAGRDDNSEKWSEQFAYARQKIENAQKMEEIRLSCQEFFDSLTAEEPSPKLTKQIDIEEICRFIDAYYFDPALSVTTIAEKFDTSISSLSKTFKKQTGTNLLTYIHLTRVNASKQLIIETSKTNGEIAQSVGYLSGWSFARSFKRILGITPTEYRSLYRPPESEEK